MVYIGTSQRMIIVDDEITLISTYYKDDFNKLGRKGRPKKDLINISKKGLYEKKKSKIRRLRNKTIRDIENLCKLNEFKYFVTIHVNSKEDYKKLMNRLKKADINLKYLSLASWSTKSDLHYHILIDSSLSLEEIERKLNKLKNYDIQEVYNQKKLVGYLRKNIVKDIIGILNSENEELEDKQLEILSFEKILSTSRNLTKPINIKIESLEDMSILDDAEHKETKEYNIGSSYSIVNRFQKNAA